MEVWENIQIGFEGIFAHKLRAFLTMLGIIFGVGAVVAMLSIGEGARREALKQIEVMGINNIIVQDRDLQEKELVAVRAGFSPGLTRNDAEAIERIVSREITAVIPLRRDEVNLHANSEKMKASLVGTTPQYLAAHNLALHSGRFTDRDDIAHNRRVCVIGSGVKRKLFPFINPLNTDIKIGQKWFTIVGVMERKNVSMKEIGGYRIRNYNEDVIVPLTASEKYIDRPGLKSPLDQIVIKLKDGADIRALADLLQRMIERRHHSQNDFEVIIPEELLRQSQSTQRIFNIVMGAIAGISLLVGGIGIMNIMLSSVLERTREIGVRRAMGARRSEIMGQFLTESITLSFSGGIIGIILGIALAKIITFYAGWITVVSIISVVSAFGVAAGVGLIFGLYPARRAANLNPIEALRYE